MIRNGVPRSGILLLGLAVAVLTAGPAAARPAAFTSTTVDPALEGAAFATAADVTGDGVPEVVASGFATVSASAIAPGTVSVYERRPGGAWDRTDVVTPAAGIRFPNEPLVDDVDGDGRSDIVVPGGFFLCPVTGSSCGSLTWWQQQPDGSWAERVVVAPGAAEFYHRAVLVDLDGDGLRDLVTVGETPAGARTVVFAGDSSPERFAKVPVVLGAGGGSLPVVEDVDADGDVDVVSGQFFQRDGSFVWFEQVAPPSPAARFGTFVRHLITAELGGAIQVALVRDLGGPGQDWWVGSNHTNQTSGPPGTPAPALYRLVPGADPRQPWTFSPLTSGIVARPDTGLGQQAGAPGVFGSGDVDADGDVDLVVSGDADPRALWVENLGGGAFATRVVADGMGQAGGAVVTDTDGRGPQVLFTSYEQDVVRLYRLAPGR